MIKNKETEMPLPLEYRPKTLDDMIGNEIAVTSLRTILKRKKKPHAMLFTGPSGCGKTTLARIVVNTLECDENDYYEMNTADFRGIGTVRDIIRNMQYKPSSGNCRIWFCDECHKLTTDAQEAFLKATEDGCPKHVYFLFATTEPGKLKATFRRRCMPFEVEPLTVREIRKYLKRVCNKEEKQVPKNIRTQIAEDSIGSLGMALMILDKVIDLDPDDMKKAAERTAAEKNETIELLRALLGRPPWKRISQILSGLEQSPETIRRAVLTYCTTTILRDPRKTDRCYVIMDAFRDNFFDSDKAGLVMACYEVSHARRD